VKVSVIIPVFNELHIAITTIEAVFSELHNQPGEIIVIDDCSTDGTYQELQCYKEIGDWGFKLFINGGHFGKGYSVRQGIRRAIGDIIIIQDADFEYSPREYKKLIQPIIDGHADVVYGSRFRGSSPKRVMYFKNYLANKFLTFMSNVFTGLNLSDMETGFKAFRSDILKCIDLKENGFGFEPEITAKVKKHRIYEVGISYYGRTYAEGKKIRPIDGLVALWCILKYNTFGG